jgi:uncharacterized DUF497 family protein
MALRRFMPRYEFTWELDKALANERKHGIAFQLASTVFNDPLAEIFHNVGHEDVEDRWSILGMTPTGVLLLVVHAYVEGRGDRCVRIISAQRATHLMKAEYHEHSENAEGELDLDFSNSIRGAFADCRFPIFIDNAVLGYFHTRARTTGVDMTDAINDVLRRSAGLPPCLSDPTEGVEQR